nr:aromatic amino acid transport family protein [Endozoicomonas sp.]
MKSEDLTLSLPSSQQSASFLGGAMIIAGTAIGAGMFSLPVVAAGMWTLWACAALLFTWFCLLHSGLMILETNLNYPVGASFNTMVKDLLGTHWNRANNLAIVFVGYILAYAYISGGSSIVVQTMDAAIGYAPSLKIAGILFSSGLAVFVWWSTKAVDRITTIMVGGMIFTYFTSVNSLAFTINTTYLLDSGNTEPPLYFPFLFAALPFFLTSFGYHHNVPSLMKYYGKVPGKIIASLLTGTILALVFYIFWLVSILGNLPRNGFSDIIAQGGNIGVLLSALSHVIDSPSA